MKPLFATILLFCFASAHAEEASCTYTYNQYSRTIVKTCRGNHPVPSLGVEERTLLIAKNASTCVVKVIFDPATQKREVVPAVCK